MKQLARVIVLLTITVLSAQGCATANLSKVYKRVDPAVVVINTAAAQQKYVTGKLVSRVDRSLGTGVIISPSGLILTAAHVVETADKVMVKLSDDSPYKAKVIASVVYADLALLQIENPPENLPWVEPGNSDNIQVGEQVFVIGTPYGVEHSLTVGYLSGRRQQPSWATKVELLQTDAAVNQGNSGGPLFSFDGELIGIVSHIKSQSGGSEGLGFAVSINVASSVLLNGPGFWSGVEFFPVPNQLARALNVPFGDGLLVQRVAKGSVANRLGLRPGKIPIRVEGTELLIGGDIVTSIEGQNIYLTPEGMSSVFEILKQTKNKDDLTLTVIREGEKIELSALKNEPSTLGNEPSALANEPEDK